MLPPMYQVVYFSFNKNERPFGEVMGSKIIIPTSLKERDRHQITVEGQSELINSSRDLPERRGSSIEAIHNYLFVSFQDTNR